MSMSKFVDHLDYAGSLANKDRQKPVVKYLPIFGFPVQAGYRATVHVISHPDPLIEDNEIVHTSTVQSVEENGRFETRNTIYELQA